MPSTVKETLAKSAEFNIYVRDRKPLVRFTGKAYVLPRTGQRGIPVVSVNTTAVALEIYRIGDRNLIETVLGRDFQRNLDRYDIDRLTEERGSQVWKGELTVEQTLNADVTTAFPVDQAIPHLAPGVYVMMAEPAGGAARISTTSSRPSGSSSPTSGSPPIPATTASTCSSIRSRPRSRKGAIEVRLMSRNNEVLATKRTSDAGHVQFEAGLTRGEGALAPAMLVVSDASGDYAFLSLKAPAFDLTDRGVSGRQAPAGLDAFVYTERGVYRSGETVHVTALLRDAQGLAARRRAADAGGRAAGRRRVSPHRGGRPGRRRPRARRCRWCRRRRPAPGACAPTPIRSAPAVGETTFLVEDYVPDRLEFELASTAKSISRTSPAEITVDGRYLYGAPAAKLELEGEVVIEPAERAAGLCRLSSSAWPTRRSKPAASRSRTCRRPTRTARRASRSRSTSCRPRRVRSRRR